MRIYPNELAATVICPNVARSCAGDRCAAWSILGDKGFCGMVSHHEIVKSVENQVSVLRESTGEGQYRKAERPAKF